MSIAFTSHGRYNATINDLNNTIITLEGNNTNLVNAIAQR